MFIGDLFGVRKFVPWSRGKHLLSLRVSSVLHQLFCWHKTKECNGCGEENGWVLAIPECCQACSLPPQFCPETPRSSPSYHLPPLLFTLSKWNRCRVFSCSWPHLIALVALLHLTEELMFHRHPPPPASGMWVLLVVVWIRFGLFIVTQPCYVMLAY